MPRQSASRRLRPVVPGPAYSPTWRGGSLRCNDGRRKDTDVRVCGAAKFKSSRWMTGRTNEQASAMIPDKVLVAGHFERGDSGHVVLQDARKSVYCF